MLEARPLPKSLERALLEVSRTLSSRSIRWILVGSTASYLHGLDVTPKDLDVVVERERVYEVDKLLASKFVAVRRVKFSSSGLYSSHYGVFRVHGVDVDIMADLEICREYGCLKLVFDEVYVYSRTVKVCGALVRLVPLEWQLVANVMIPGKEGRVKVILDAFRTRGIDRGALDSALRHSPAEVRSLVSKMIREAGMQGVS